MQIYPSHFIPKFFLEPTTQSTPHSSNTRLNSDIILTSVQAKVAAEINLYKRVNFYSSVPYELKCVSDYEKLICAMKSCLLNIQEMLTVHDFVFHAYLSLCPFLHPSLITFSG